MIPAFTTILLIEDDKSIRRFLKMTLEAEGMSILEASTGKQGLVEAALRRPELIILDLGLPDMDGVEAIKQLRTWSTLPILILSARSDEGQKVRALDAGADDYLTKPFGTLELLARIRAHLRKRATSSNESQSPIFEFGDVHVDFLSRRVSRANQEIHLTPTEYKLLSTLIRSVGKVLTHRQLLQEVWGTGHTDRAHYLRIYMAHLRHKLEADPARPTHILTETGIGYRLVD